MCLASLSECSASAVTYCDGRCLWDSPDVGEFRQKISRMTVEHCCRRLYTRPYHSTLSVTADHAEASCTQSTDNVQTNKHTQTKGPKTTAQSERRRSESNNCGLIRCIARGSRARAKCIAKARIWHRTKSARRLVRRIGFRQTRLARACPVGCMPAVPHRQKGSARISESCLHRA